MGKTQFDPRRMQLASDPYRPAYHFLAPANWLNDPNGTIWWQNRYHIFYQYNPDGAYWGNIHWGHASSEDLVHWTDHPVALAPTPGAPDAGGCWSGTAFCNRDGVPTLIYHGVPGGICIATSDDPMLCTWTKHPANPVIPEPSASDPYLISGAPCAWIEPDRYYAVTGNSIHSPDTAYLFASQDLLRWEYLHPLYEGGRFTQAGEDCAVPDFFPLQDRHVLFFASHRCGAQCYIGTYADHRFVPQRHRRLAYGERGRVGILNECLSLKDGSGRRILFGRIAEGRYGQVTRAAGWAGIFALPMVLDLDPTGDLLIEPAGELDALRHDHHHLSDIRIDGAVVPLAEVGGNMLQIRTVWTWQDAEEFGLKVCCSPDGQEQTLIRLNTNPTQANAAADQVRPLRQLILDPARSSLSDDVASRDTQWCTFDLPYGRQLELAVFIDRSVVEVFANGRHYLTKRIYPAGRDSVHVQAYAVAGRATIRSLDAWQMAPIWPVTA